jgi:hypothetical protein
MKPFAAAGHWWTADKAQSVAGTVHFEYDRPIRLELSGALDGSSENPLHPIFPIIFGLLSSNKPVTLLYGSQIALSRDTEGIGRSQTIHAGHILLGGHAPLGLETSCDAVYLVFEHLGEWSSGGAWTTRDSSTTEDGSTIETLTFTYPPPITFDFLNGSLILSAEGGRSSSAIEEVIQRRMRLVYLPNEPVGLASLFDPLIEALEQFFTFACSTAARCTGIDFTSPEVREHYLGDEREYSPTIEYGWTNQRIPADEDQPSFYMMLPMRTIQDRLPEVLQGWNELRTSAIPVFDLLFLAELGPHVYVETRFLFIAQALEVYHRRRLPGIRLSKAEHRARLRAIDDAITDAELSAWVEDKLQHSNEVTFRERIEDLLDHVGFPARSVTRAEFAEVVTNTRNYHTHFDKKLEAKAAKDNDLRRLTEEMTALGLLCLLRDLGFSEDEAYERLSGTPQVRAIRRWLSGF